MLIDEFVELRVRAGETERTTQEQEHVRRAGERGRWLRSLGERRPARAGRGGTTAVGADAVGAAAGAPAGPSAPAGASVAADPSPVVAEPERELAHAAR
jgi:hypothetical protein